MGLLKKLIPLALGTALTFLPSKLSANPLSINLFPEMPVYRSVMVDSNIPKTEINIPSGLEQEVLGNSFAGIISYTSLSKEIPVLSVDIKSDKPWNIIPPEVVLDSKTRALREGKKLSDKIFSASLIASGSIKFPKNENPIYSARAELFLNSPMIDDYLSEGNKLLLVTGFNGNGSVRLNNLADKNISSIPEMFSFDSYSFFGDAYIVAKSPYSSQYILLRSGIDNLFGNAKETANINLSLTCEFPPLISWIEIFKDFRILPYVSLGVKLPLDSSATNASAELGAKLTGKSEKSLMIYGKADYSIGSMKYSTGLKLDL